MQSRALKPKGVKREKRYRRTIKRAKTEFAHLYLAKVLDLVTLKVENRWIIVRARRGGKEWAFERFKENQDLYGNRVVGIERVKTVRVRPIEY